MIYDSVWRYYFYYDTFLCQRHRAINAITIMVITSENYTERIIRWGVLRIGKYHTHDSNMSAAGGDIHEKNMKSFACEESCQTIG